MCSGRETCPVSAQLLFSICFCARAIASTKRCQSRPTKAIARSTSALSGNADRECSLLRSLAVSGIGAGRQRQAVRENILLQRRIFGTQPRDLALEHGAILGRGLAGPADGVLAAKRDLAGLGIEPHESRHLTLLKRSGRLRCRQSRRRSAAGRPENMPRAIIPGAIKQRETATTDTSGTIMVFSMRREDAADRAAAAFAGCNAPIEAAL